MLSTNGAITARCAKGLSSGEEPDLVDWCFMSGKLHLALSSAWVPHSDTAIGTLQGARANGSSGPHTLNTQQGCGSQPHTHTTTKGEGCSQCTHRGGKHAEGVPWVKGKAAGGWGQEGGSGGQGQVARVRRAQRDVEITCCSTSHNRCICSHTCSMQGKPTHVSRGPT